ncbi:hypothetical protein [Caulobacter sp. RL271]|uniref:Uncharacterized protein n=1 Tax=Caulobacter segnis TaxID=88688 RepID=A0ABY4ZW18_9CAUL|nr:hypothetical protein [Caulobacter segnis]USQ96829.1 hypothetical protein MZV50_04455 [Caulobacter segnis]
MKTFFTAACAASVIFVCAPAFAQTTVQVPEGTELSIRFDDSLSSETSHEGDRFSISLAEDVTLADGTTLPAGLRGAGEVTHAKKKGMMGKPGELNVRFDYLKAGNARIRLRGQKGAEGSARYGTTITLTVLFGPLGLIKHGKDVEIKSGQRLTAFVDQDSTVTTPIVAPGTVPSPAPSVAPAAAGAQN